MTLYLFTVVTLLLAAALRNHLTVWLDVSSPEKFPSLDLPIDKSRLRLQEYKTGGARALVHSVQASMREVTGRLRRTTRR